jgi:hypothetical protein
LDLKQLEFLELSELPVDVEPSDFGLKGGGNWSGIYCRHLLNGSYSGEILTLSDCPTFSVRVPTVQAFVCEQCGNLPDLRARIKVHMLRAYVTES